MQYQRKREPLDPCPVEVVLEMIGGKWKARIMHLLLTDRLSFAALRRQLTGVSQQVLSTQLASMVKDNLISRSEFRRGGTTRCEYALTAMGLSLIPVMNGIGAWGQQLLNGQTQRNVMSTMQKMEGTRMGPL